jgi:hypothetical protein
MACDAVITAATATIRLWKSKQLPPIPVTRITPSCSPGPRELRLAFGSQRRRLPTTNGNRACTTARGFSTVQAMGGHPTRPVRCRCRPPRNLCRQNIGAPRAYRNHQMLRERVTAAAGCGNEMVCTFVGRDQSSWHSISPIVLASDQTDSCSKHVSCHFAVGLHGSSADLDKGWRGAARGQLGDVTVYQRLETPPSGPAYSGVYTKRCASALLGFV